MTQEQKAFIERVGRIASADMIKSGVLASMKIAQAILESGWGKSGLTVKANALFGIKATSAWKGKVFNTKTQECFDGINFTTIDALFRAYGSWEESITDHSAFLTANARYAAVLGERDYKKACRAIHAAGYATDPGYTGKLIKIIEQYKLTAYDMAATTTAPSAAGPANGGKGMKIYFSPSNQGANRYVVGNTTEKIQMEALAAKTKAIMEKEYNCEIVMATLSMGIGHNERPLEAKNKGCTYYICFHSDATGATPPQRTATGSTVFFHPNSAKGKEIAAEIVKELAAVNPTKSNRASPVQNGMTQFNGQGFGEVRSPMQHGVQPVFIEVDFHDNPVTAQWIIDNHNTIAAAIARAITKALGITKKSGVTPAPTPPAPSKPATPTPTPPTAPPTTPATSAGHKVGDVVQFTGGAVYRAANAPTAAHTRTASRCKVTVLSNGAKYPLHIVSEDGGGVHGWVAAANVKAAEYRVMVSRGTSYRTGAGNNFPVAGTITDGGVFTIAEEQNGWGRLVSGAGWLKLSSVQRI